MKKLIILPFIVYFLLVAIIPTVAAQDSSSLIPGADVDSEKYRTGDYTLCDILQIFVNASRWILGLSGGTALILFIWGGFTWITAAGNAEKIKSGQKVLTGTVFGLILILGAWFLVGTVIGMLVPTSPEGKLAGLVTWWEIKCP